MDPSPLSTPLSTSPSGAIEPDATPNAAGPGFDAPEPAPSLAAATGTRLRHWVREGLRAAVFMRPRVPGGTLQAWHLAALFLVSTAIELLLARFTIVGPVDFNLRGWLASWWSLGLVALLGWGVFSRGARAGALVAWLALWVVALAPIMMTGELLGIAHAHELLPPAFRASPYLAWGVYIALLAWPIAVSLRLAGALGLRARPLAALGVGLVAIYGLSVWQFQDRPWEQDYEAVEAQREKRPRLVLNQQAIEGQQAAWTSAVQALAPERPGVTDVYGLVFAPYADEDVFLRESTLVATLLAERFDAAGRVLHLANHATTTASLPWATPLNLERAVQALAARMDRDNDLLVVYLTSHGARNFRLSARHWPLEVDDVSPSDLRQALDQAGIRHRVIAVSACYSGGWIGPLASSTSLVMTAADPERTSYGCGRKSELTFFGRAVFAEQLRQTRSFEAAFAQAVPLIRQREIDAGKSDGFSNPQISIGEGIRPVLRELEQRLDAAAPG